MQLRHASAAWRVPHTLIATTCAPAHSQTARGAGAAEGDQQTLPFITNNITTKRLGQGQASWRAGARPVHPCAPPRCSMLLERPRPTSGRGATASLCCVALYVSWIHLVPSTTSFRALKEAFEGALPRKSQESQAHYSWNIPLSLCFFRKRAARRKEGVTRIPESSYHRDAPGGS